MIAYRDKWHLDWPDDMTFDESVQARMNRLDWNEDVIVSRGGISRRVASRAIGGHGGKEQEEVARWLRRELEKLRTELKVSGSHPIRGKGLMSRQEIADIAMSMCGSSDEQIGNQLSVLLHELLDLDHYRATLSSKNGEAFRDAAFMDAQHLAQGLKPMSDRKLAEEIGVAFSTVHKWRKRPEFKKQVERATAMMSNHPFESGS